MLFRAALVALIFGCLFEIGRRRGIGLRRAAWLTLAAFVVSVAALALRPQLIGMALFAVVLLLIVDRRAHPGRLWVVPVIVLVWANIHGSFFLGPLVLGLAWLEDLHDGSPSAAPHASVVALASAAAACVTPFGPAVWAYAVGLSTNPEVTRRITEWQPTSLRDVPGLLFFASALAVAVLIARRGRPTPWPTLAWLGVFFVIGAYAARGIAWWPLGAVVAIAGVLVTDPSRASPSAPRPPGWRPAERSSWPRSSSWRPWLLVPAWRPGGPGARGTAGRGGDRPVRDHGRRSAASSGPEIGSTTRSRGAPGSSSPCPTPRSPSIRGSSSSRPRSGTTTSGSQPGADGWQALLTRRLGGDRRRGRGGRRRPLARLSAAGWRTAYSDADGTVLLAPNRS